MLSLSVCPSVCRACRTWMRRITKESRPRPDQSRPEPTRLCGPQPFELNWLSRQQRRSNSARDSSSHSPRWSQSQFRFVWDHFAKGCDFCWLSRVWHMEIIKSAAKHQAQSSKKPRLPPSTTLFGEGGDCGVLYDTSSRFCDILSFYHSSNTHTDILATSNTQWT